MSVLDLSELIKPWKQVRVSAAAAAVAVAAAAGAARPLNQDRVHVILVATGEKKWKSSRPCVP